MLAEVAGGGIEPSHIVNPIRGFAEADRVPRGRRPPHRPANKVVETEHPQSHAPSTLHYDRLVIALGSVTNYRGLPGVKEHSFGLKTMADAQAIRDHVLSVLEQAALVRRPEQRACMLTFVIAGGGFSGAELCGALARLTSSGRCGSTRPSTPARSGWCWPTPVRASCPRSATSLASTPARR